MSGTTKSMRVRPAAVAGMFYPADAAELRWFVETELRAAMDRLDSAMLAGPPPRAIIGPHAGFIYSGSVAASAYGVFQGEGRTANVRRIVIISPAHRVAVVGIAASSADAFATPLGLVPVDRQATDSLCEQFDFVNMSDEAHAPEHGVEAHLPFCQALFQDFSIVPLAMGQVSPQQVAQVLDTLWDEQTLIAVSSDLSHFYSYDDARALDAATCKAIEQLQPHDIAPEQACGRPAVQAILTMAEQHHLTPTTLDLRNSGDTAGPRHQVVGYGAWAFTA